MDFYQYLYITTIKKLAVHLPHLKIIGTHHCGNTRQGEFKSRPNFQDVLYRYNNEERVVAIFANQIQSEFYHGNRSVSIEGVLLDHFSDIDQ